MADEAGEANWLSVGKAARALGVSKGAIRKLVATGALIARGDGESTSVLLPAAGADASVAADVPATPSESGSERSSGDATPAEVETPAVGGVAMNPVDADPAVQVAALTERAEQLAARLAAAEAERDRWVAATADARLDARAAFAARDDAERELRLLLARAQFGPALPPGADKEAAESSGRPARLRRRFWRGWR
jgi:hypothetical protein